MIHLNRILLVLSLIILTSCGGGGGGGGDASNISSYTITTNAEANGNISPTSRSIDHNTVATFTITPDAGYSIGSVSGCGGLLAGNNYVTGLMTGDCTINASFISNGGGSYTVDATAGTGGTISPLTVNVIPDAITSFTVTPDAGYNVDSVTGCGGALAGNVYTTGSVTADCTVSVSFISSNVNPTLNIADASVTEGNSGTTHISFTVSLTAAANGDVNVDYMTSDETATAGSDYVASSGTLVIASGTTSSVLNVVVNSDFVSESDESFTVTLSGLSVNATLGDGSARGTISNDDGVAFKPLNDTGITSGIYVPSTWVWGNNNENLNRDCVGETINQQDCSVGRDVTHNDDSDGRAGFSYTKLDARGNALPYSASAWSCVRDNVTGLIWEVKVMNNQREGENLHDGDDMFSWYNTDPVTNGGQDGYAAPYIDKYHCFGGVIRENCNTQTFIAKVNASVLCGASDWRLPNKIELFGLSLSSSSIFGRTRTGDSWSSTPGGFDRAWRVSSGSTMYALKRDVPIHVRLVRDGK